MVKLFCDKMKVHLGKCTRLREILGIKPICFGGKIVDGVNNKFQNIENTKNPKSRKH